MSILMIYLDCNTCRQGGGGRYKGKSINLPLNVCKKSKSIENIFRYNKEVIIEGGYISELKLK